MTGANTDGADGVLAISRRGGLVLVQDPQEAEMGLMPQAGIDILKNERCPLVLGLDGIASYIASVAQKESLC